MEAIAADIDQHNYRVFLSELDVDRTVRIYKALANLSGEAVAALNSENSREFSVITDRMRPLLSYISDNSVKLSAFFDKDGEQNSELVDRDPEIKQSISQLNKNLKIIENVRLTMSQVPFNPVFFFSEELTNAFLDYKLELAWDFDFDVIFIFNLDDVRCIDTLVSRGQKRFILIGGSVNAEDCHSVINTGGHLFKTEDKKPLMKAGGLPTFPGRPPHRFTFIDVGKESTSAEEQVEIITHLNHERNNQWARFNTINRGDATRVLDNLRNMAAFDQATIYQKKFEGKSAVIVTPGPSLEKNVELLKEIKGKVLIICVLHALRELQKRNIVPDVVIHVDPADLKKLNSKTGLPIEDGKEISHYDDWIGGGDVSKIPRFVISNYSAPNLFASPFKNILWMSPGLPIGEFIPEEAFNFSRVGGSVSHSAFDLAIEWGCESVALIGQDLAVSKKGDIYASKTELDLNDEEKNKLKQKVYGADVEVKGFNGGKVISNNTFVAFAKAYSLFARELKDTKVKLFNCTEGGMFIEGFKHIKFKEFIEMEKNKKTEKCINQIFSENRSDPSKISDKKKKARKFIVRNNILSLELGKLISTVIEIAEKNMPSDEDLAKFDKLQNKLIKKMKKNMFYSLGLQRDIYILQAGIRADNSLDGQLGFHRDFLRVARNLNNRFIKTYKEQLALLNN